MQGLFSFLPSPICILTKLNSLAILSHHVGLRWDPPRSKRFSTGQCHRTQQRSGPLIALLITSPSSSLPSPNVPPYCHVSPTRESSSNGLQWNRKPLTILNASPRTHQYAAPSITTTRTQFTSSLMQATMQLEATMAKERITGPCPQLAFTLGH